MNKSNNNNNNIHNSIPTIEFTINQNNHQNNNNKQFKNFHHFIERSINRTIITNEGVMVDELLKGTNKTGHLSKVVMAKHLKRYHRESITRLNMRKAVLRGDQVERQYGCGKCRWTPKGCGRCKAEGFVLGPKEGLTRVGIPRPGEEMSLVPIGSTNDMGGMRKKLMITNKTPICNNIYEKTNGKERGYGIITLEDIKKGEPILEFVGELLTHEQAMKREEYYTKMNINCCYQLKLGYGACQNVIDPTLYGNFGRFANSSCNSNMICKRLEETELFKNERNCRYIRPMFYAARDIKKGEELTWMYNNHNGSGGSSSSSSNNNRRSSRKRKKSTGGEEEKKKEALSSSSLFDGGIGDGGYQCFCGEINCKSTL